MKTKEMKTLNEFDTLATYIKLNDEEGYYECQGFKSFDTRKLFVMWANANRGFKLKK